MFEIFSNKYNFTRFSILVYSAIIAGKAKLDDEIFLRLFDLAKDTHKAYINKIIKSTKERAIKAQKDPCGIDALLKEIMHFLKCRPELAQRINFAIPKGLIDDDDIVALRVFDFLVDEVRSLESKKLF